MADVSDNTTAPEIHSDTQTPLIEFEASHAAYCGAQAALSECQKTGAGERQLRKHMDRRDDAVWALIRALTPNRWMLVEKMYLLLELMEGGKWTDRRDLLLAASILRDVQKMEQRS
jgi:hypothetical protein